MTDLFAEVNGIKICYEVLGEGEPVILVHGFSDRKEHWAGQFSGLAKHFKVIRADNRGAGKSDRPDGPYSMGDYADDINGLMRHLEIEKTHIIGHSLGGMIVQNFALKYPDRINKIILVNTIPGITPPNMDPSQIIEVFRKSAITGLEAKKRDPLGAVIAGAKTSYSRDFWKQMRDDPKKKFHGLWSVEDLVDEHMTFGPTEKDLNNQADSLKTHNVYERLHEIKNETLVLSAEKDKTCPSSMGQIIHELLPNSKMIVIEKAGHQSILEYAPLVNQHIIDFL